MKRKILYISLLFILLIAGNSGAQYGRIYVDVPLHDNIFQLHYNNIFSNTWEDQSLPVDNTETRNNLASLFYTHVMNFFGRCGGIGLGVSASSLLSYNPDLDTITQRVWGVGDPSLTLDMNVFGGPAVSRKNWSTFVPMSYMSAHFVMGLPLGNYDKTKSTNIGSNRYTYKFVVNMSITTMKGKNWLDFYGSVKFSSTNSEFLVNHSLAQDPLFGLEAHYSQDIGNKCWVNAGLIYSGGGRTKIDGSYSGNAQSSVKGSVAVSFPTWIHGSAIVGYNNTLWKTAGSPEVHQLIIQLNHTF
ncbi:MAG: hypothetical protein NTV87_15515 [Ignavibacteriae bacterium]|jgi:hypothetical protein|nr:hypothetical protein [Ignavibacteriota bacterium]